MKIPREERETIMLTSLKSHVSTIFIMLGNNCNFKCRYCLQHVDTGLIEDLPQDINPDIYDYIYHNCMRRDMNDAPINLHFYGGEPLLYFDKIKEIVKETEFYPNISYSFISNGWLIDQEKADFFNEHNFSEAISWDGNRSIDTRMQDVFSDPDRKKAILSLNRLSLSAVLSGATTPKQILTDFESINIEYKKLHNYSIGVNIDELFDTGVADRDLFNIDFEQIRQEMSQMTNEYIVALQNQSVDMSRADMNFIGQLINTVRNYYKQTEHYTWHASCGNGINTINMDLQGDFYNCHNSSVKTGSIYHSVMSNIGGNLKYDTTKEDILTLCVDCPVISLCRGGCKLLSKEKKQEGYCELKRAVFSPIIETILNLT
jgi:uncharacterized protein